MHVLLYRYISMESTMMLFRATALPLQLPTDGLLERGFAIYRALLDGRDARRMVLFESLGRHSIDARSSLIALDPALDVTVHDTRVTLSGHAVPLAAAASALADYAPVRVDAGIVYTLAERADVWNFLRTLESAFRVEQPDGAAPLALFGYFGYDTIRYIESVPRHRAPIEGTPDIALSLYRTLIVIDAESATLTHYRHDGDEAVDLDALRRVCESARGLPGDGDEPTPRYAVRFETPRADYLAKCERALEHIRVGDVYQIQIGQKVRVETALTPLALYARLRRQNPSPYMYLFSAGGATIVGASPELFVRTEGRDLVMRPIAGTVGKAGGRTRDDAEREMRDSEKETAEHLMLVDLCRNDLCRVCEPGSLRVDDLMQIEEYSHVFHMVSSTLGRLKSRCDKYDAIRATFPAGTMTG
ncbi:MAG TPA: anthranilate synthase component I family protein, partial [Tahibacter sp.]|nr:anthranilate synthase component I family protein [Tahibacter sp.]